jgi:tetratricopeptide (TPR) repeat protein
MKKFGSIFFFCCLTLHGLCLNPSAEDSLHKALIRTTDIEGKVRIYISLAKLFKTDSPDSCLLFLDEAQKLFRNINSLYYLGEVNEIRGDVARTRNDFDEAVRYYKVAIYCYAKKGDKKQQVKLLNFIGGAYAQTGNLSEAFRNYLKAREFAGEIEDLDMQARINNNLGRIFVASEQYSTGIEYYEKALAVFQANADSFKMATVLMNLGAAFNHIQETDSSRTCSNKAISIFKAIKKKYYLGSSYQIYAFSLITEKKYPEALSYLEKTLKIAEEPGTGNELIESKLLLSDVLVFSGITHYLLGDFLLAGRYLRQGYHLSDSLEVMERSKEALEYLSLAYEKMGRTDSSYYFFKLFKKTTDSLNKIQSINIMKLAEVQMEYEKDVKENKMQLAYAKGIQNRNLAIFIGAAAILLSLIIILLMRLRLENQKKKQIRIEKRQAELEKEAADLKVESQNKELATKVMHSTMVNEMVLRIAENLRKMEIPEDSPNGKIKNELVRELLNSTSKEDNWKEFEIRFQNVHTDFYKHLRDKYPDLTTNEIRLSALLRLNMTTKEISALTHQSERAIVLSRHRLRHKFGLQTSDNLVVFLSQF